MKSLFPQEMMKTELTLETVISKLTYFQEQTHLLHWQATSYAQHKALGKLYEYLQDFKDGLVEKLMGYMGKKPGIPKMEQLTKSTPQETVNLLIGFAGELKSFGEKYAYHDICNLSDSLSGEAAKTLYLLTLS